ncbi:thioredoxin domain-containing protein [Planosporangium flavigriseum]|uniref:Membrane protein n=1 Tax=Planosporangium flavigriseum TaxID=373681 RepID=A0A8J3LP07_9ACTN|nr:thioredoxin domain-containing protein [Planosporangium flavigriseum]NJC66944.1 thioredoxin domain-containing protein [Planosporangium flavigriseum]GIG73993.1 membrane protein [Planosporangium flavigriseum]
MSSRANKKQAAKVVREQIARERARARRVWVSIAAVAVLVIAGLVGWGVYSSQRSSSFTAPAHATANGDGLVVGAGPKTVELYLDFICPACRNFEESGGSSLNQMAAANKIKLVYHPVAFLDRASTTQYSTRSAAAAGCASDAGKLPEFVQAMYANQPPEGSAGLSNDQIIQLAHRAGITGSGFDTCVRDGKYRPWVQHVTDAAVSRGVTGTPTVFVEGKQVEARLPAITQALGGGPVG